MTISVTLNTISNLQDTTTAQTNINDNSAAITGGFSTALNVTGDQMKGNLDMNSNQILNLPVPATINSPARLADIVSASTALTVPTVGTSGPVVPLLNTANTWSATQTFSTVNVSTATISTLNFGTLSGSGLPALTGVNVWTNTNSFSGTTNFTGTVNLPPHSPAFRANKNNVNQTGIANTSYTLVTWSTATFDNGGHFSTASSAWFPPPGVVYVSAGLVVDSGADTGNNNAIVAKIFKNGSADVIAAANGPNYAFPGYGAVNLGGIDLAATGDYYQVELFLNSTGSNAVIDGNPAHTWFSGAWIGPF